MERDARKNNKEVKAPGLEPCLEVHNGFILVNYKRTEEAIREERERKRKRLIHSINMPKNIAEARFSDTALTKKRRCHSRVIEFYRSLQNGQHYIP